MAAKPLFLLFTTHNKLNKLFYNIFITLQAFFHKSSKNEGGITFCFIVSGKKCNWEIDENFLA